MNRNDYVKGLYFRDKIYKITFVGTLITFLVILIGEIW